MDYKKAAQELFEILMLETEIFENIEVFNLLCDRYPELMDEYMKQVEEDIKDVELPKESEEQKQESYEGLCRRIRAKYGENVID